MSKTKRQKVYLVMQFPKHPSHHDNGRVIDVHGTAEGADRQIKRLVDKDPNSTYHRIKKSVKSSIVHAEVNRDIDFDLVTVNYN